MWPENWETKYRTPTFSQGVVRGDVGGLGCGGGVCACVFFFVCGRLPCPRGGADGVPKFGADGWPSPANNSDLKLAGRLAPTAGPFHLPSPDEQQIFQSAPFERFDF